MANHGSRGASHIQLHSLRDLLRIVNMDCRLYLVTLCLIFILASFYSCNAQGSNLVADQKVDANDLAVLQAFQKAADGKGFLSQNWTGDQYCNWDGITCKRRTTRVSHIDLFSKGLNGTIPENTLGNLTELQYFGVANNTLSGPFPTDLKNLNNLVHFLAYDNEFSESFPNLSTTSTISRLDLSFNKLSGPITLNLTGLINLTSLNLSTNQFSGGVPPLPSSLTDLNMTDNNFSQVSPEENSRFPTAFLGNTNLCVGNATYCNSIQSSGLAPTPAPVPSSNPKESGKKGLSPKSIVFIVLSVLIVLFFLLGYSRYFYLTRFEKPGGAYYHCFHPEPDMEKTPEDSRSPSPPADER